MGTKEHNPNMGNPNMVLEFPNIHTGRDAVCFHNSQYANL